MELNKKIEYILGNDFVKYDFSETKFNKNDKIYYYKLINYNILNKNKSIYVKKKIKELKENNFTEIEEIKYSGIGRFIKIHIKTLDDY